MSNVDHSALLCIRMIKALLEELDLPRRPLLFCVELCPVAPLGDGSGSSVQIWILRNRQFARTLLKWADRASSIAFGDCWLLPLEHHDTASTVPGGAAAPFAATARFATVGNWTARRR
jgi:hypothetical protein